MGENKRLKRKVRNSYIISTVSMSLVLFLLGSVGYLILNALDATDRMKESVSVYVMLEDGLTQEKKDTIKTRLLSDEIVREVIYVSKEQAAKEYKEYSGEEFENFLEFNPLPDSFEVKLKASGSDLDILSAFEKKALASDGVDEVVYQRSIIGKIGENISTFNMVLLIFGAALLFISVILLNNTIRVSIYAKRHIISAMKLVGATKGFIMKPFLKNALLQGIYASLIAGVMFIGLVVGLNRGLPEIRFTMVNEELAWILGGMMVLGILISLVFTIFAVNKFVKLPTNAIHLY